MPSVYTHYKFACDALERMSEGLKRAATENRKLYDAGQSGADILFYYKPHKSNELRKYGSSIHRVRADELFSRFKEILTSDDLSRGDIAYLAGYYTHFILDSTMHPYIWKCNKENIAPHFVIEADYDRKLLLRDGKNPYKADFLDFQTVDDEVAHTASKYLACTPKQIKEVFSSRVKFTKLISSRNALIRGFLKFIFKISSNPKGNDILIPLEDVPACEEISRELERLYKKALDEVEAHSREFEEFLLGKGVLGERFSVDFE